MTRKIALSRLTSPNHSGSRHVSGVQNERMVFRSGLLGFIVLAAIREQVRQSVKVGAGQVERFDGGSHDTDGG